MEILIFLSLSRSQSIFDRIPFFSNDSTKKKKERTSTMSSTFSLFFFFNSFKRERERKGDEKQGRSRATQKSKVLQTNLNPGLKEKLDVHAFTLASLSSICPGFTSVHAGIIGSLFFVSKGSSSRPFLLSLSLSMQN